MATSENRSGQDDQVMDPWQAVSYMLSGVIVYGLAGFGLDVWLGTDFLVGIGIVLGAALGIAMVWMRWGRTPEEFDLQAAARRDGQPERRTTEQETQ